MRYRSLSIVATIGLLASGLGGCSSVNERLSAGMGDYIPQWAGGLPADAPPRPGTARYDEWMKERERNRLLPASERDASKDSAKAGESTGKLDPAH